MTLHEAIRNLLLADNAVSALVGTRISPAPAPPAAALYRVTIQRIDTFRDYTLDGPSGFMQPRWQVDCWSDRAAGGSQLHTNTLANAVRQALNGYSGLAGTIPIGNIELDDEADDWDEAAASWRTRLDFIVTTNED